MPAPTTLTCALILLGTAFLAHGLLLVNDGLYWDGWIIDAWQQLRDWPGMRRFYSEVGMPVLFLEHKAMARLPGRVFWYKAIGFAFLYAGALAIFLAAARFGHLTHLQALVLALLVLVFPGNQMLPEICISLNYMVPVGLFFVASWLGLVAAGTPGQAHWVLHGAAILLFLFSFNMNSLLVYYFGFLALLVLTQGHGLLKGNAALFILPMVFWVWKERFTPRYGAYATYNRLRITREVLLAGFTQALEKGLHGTVGDALAFLWRRPALWALCLAPAGLLYRFAGPGPAASLRLVAFGLLLLFLAGLPYILVGQPFTRRGWGTKNNILLAVPFALLTLGAGARLFNPVALACFLAILVTASILYLNYVYLAWLAVWAKNLSFLSNLATVPGIGRVSVLGVCDLHPIRGSFDDGHPEHMNVYLTYMFTYLWGSLRKLGMAEREPRRQGYTAAELAAAVEATTLGYDLTELDLAGPQAMVTIFPGPRTGGELATGWAYLVHRFFRRAGYFDFMAGLTRVVVTRLERPAAPAPTSVPEPPAVPERPAAPEVPAPREALLHAPDWAGEAWVDLLFTYLDAYRAGDPVALVLMAEPAPEGLVPLDLVREVIIDWAGRSGRESFPDIVVLDRPGALLEHLRPCASARWVTAADLKQA